LRREKKNPAENGRVGGKMSAWSFLAGLALVALFAVSCGSVTGGQSAKEPAEDEPRAEVERAQAEKKEEPQAETDLENPSLGNEDAPVLVIEYADFQ